MILYILIFIIFLVVLGVISFAYDWLRHKINKPRIGGIEYFLRKLVDKGDYLCINGKVYCFDHFVIQDEIIDITRPPSNGNIAIKGNMAFSNYSSLNYLYLSKISLRNCEFIYGKYGLKWAISTKWAEVAKEKVNEYIWN